MADNFAMAGPQHMPSSAVAAATIVLLYSLCCFVLGIMLISVLVKSGERYTYVLLFAISTTLSTTTSCLQLLYYMARWHEVVVGTYEATLRAYSRPELAFGPFSTGYLSVLYWIANYLYNVDALLMLFWAINLTISVWQWRPKRITPYFAIVGNTSKVFAWIMPAIIVGLSPQIANNTNFAGALFVTNIFFFISCTFGAVCVILILSKYLASRLGFLKSSHAYSASTPATQPTYGLTSTIGGGANRPPKHNRVRVDHWLVLRFSIAFVLLLALEVFLIYFRVSRYHKIQHSVALSSPNFTAGSTINDIVNFIPQVTVGLLAFFLFGTTAVYRKQYAQMFRSLFCLAKRPTSSPTRLQGSSAQDWDRLSNRNATGPARSSDEHSAIYELETSSTKGLTMQDKSNIHITSEIVVQEERRYGDASV